MAILRNASPPNPANDHYFGCRRVGGIHGASVVVVQSQNPHREVLSEPNCSLLLLRRCELIFLKLLV
jgi:hypothetical protein